MIRWPWDKKGEKKAQPSFDETLKRAARFQAWLASCSPALDPPGGIYACWWTEEDDPRFTSSKTFMSMKRAYAALPGAEGHYLAILAKYCLKEAPTATVLPLPSPEDASAFGVSTPAGPVILRISGEKGIQFLFPRSIPRSEREAIWVGLADMAEGTKAYLSRTGKKETPSDSRVQPGEWWEYSTASLSRIEAEGKIVSAFGVVFHRMGVSPGVNVDALLAAADGRQNFMEFPTEGMTRHYEVVLKKRMEGQAMQMSLIR